MKNLSAKVVALVFTMSAFLGQVLAQTTDNISYQDKKFNHSQTVAAKASTDDNMLIISGKILDASTMQPVGKAKINTEKFGDELVQASIDNDGRYAIALRKDELGEPMRVTFKIPGYKRFVVKNIDKRQNFADINVLLEPEDSKQKSSGNIVYKMSSDPFNPLVLRFE
jgi:hypothetical protein